MKSCLLLSLILVLSSGCREAGNTPDIWVVSTSPFEEWVPLVATLEAEQPLTFRAERNGLSKLIELIEDGTPVEAGDVIARFDRSELEERIRNLTRDRDIAQATYTALVGAEHPLELQRLTQELSAVEADLGKERALRNETESLVREDLLAPEELEVHDQTLQQLASRRSALQQQMTLTETILHPAKEKTARARLDAAEASLADAQQELESTVVRAPSAGTVHLPLIPIDGERRPARVGDGLFRNQVYLQLSDLTRLVLRAEIGERLVSNVAPGMNARVRGPSLSHQIFSARVAEVGAYPRGADRRYPVELHLDSPVTTLRPGLTALVEVLSFREEQAWVIPHRYLIREGGETFVRTRSARHPVDIASTSPDGVWVRSGVKDGMELIRP
jgi:multidrug efflux pump subunit AcrA (membrane-fusion protein)